MQGEGWERWKGKTVYIRLSKGREYTGKVMAVDINPTGLTFVTILDKFGKYVAFLNSEITLIQEEDRNG